MDLERALAGVMVGVVTKVKKAFRTATGAAAVVGMACRDGLMAPARLTTSPHA